MKHRFCKVTGHCKRCGLTRDRWVSAVPSIINCYSASAPVTSLIWWRKLVAHNRLKDQLVKSVELALKEK